ncbi:hypothetical protein TrVE_jg8391 [Triparma verrucosa]|uniref:Fatty acid hydroxylase domain-containing protein n=1 Tax=Triparma verrucosa TaxID=1606542 RepID=A0A9W7CIH5_9STRA|nr:hypothetical protein TrVE_jg8391 [Triparma verrucosa]
MEYLNIWSSYISASSLILKFYANHVVRFNEIHSDLPSGVLQNNLRASITKKSNAKVTLNAEFGDEFNASYKALVPALRKELKGKLKWNFTTILVWSFIVRFAWFAAITKYGFFGSIGTGMWQFVFAPLSFVVCVLRFCTNGMDCIFHYLINVLVCVLLNAVPFEVPTFIFTIDANFAVGFFAVDFVLNCLVYFSSSEPFGFKRFLKHVLYGTLNTKTYFLIIFSSLSGLKISFTTAFLTGLLNLHFASSGSRSYLLRLMGLPSFPILFYCEHRLGHCPGVYPHAHKQHHYLHDTTSFDAHIYGSGMNEEYFWVLAEIVPCLLSPEVTLFPYFLNLETLKNSWTNKGGHTRSDPVGVVSGLDYDQDNFHADHHTQHNSNFGSADFPLLDFYFGTKAKGGQVVDDVEYRMERRGGNVDVTMNIIGGVSDVKTE